MANKIRVSTDWLESCARDLQSINDSISSASGTLSGIQLRRDEGGALKVSLSCALRMTGGNFSGSTASDDVRALQQASKALAAAAAMLSRSAFTAANAFETAEDDAVRLLTGLRSGTGAAAYEKGGGDSGAGGGGAVSWILPALREFKEWILSKLQEIREQAANDARVFDDDGQYGSDQGSPVNDRARYEEYRSIIENNIGRNLSDRELAQYLARLNSEGCGYSCIVNEIFRKYEGRAEEFERVFGFPMYRNGDLDYNRLLVDVYSKTDNRYLDASGIDMFNPNEDRTSTVEYEVPYDPYTDMTGSGTTTGELDYRTKLYLEAYGLDADVSTYEANDVTVDNFAEFSQQGEVRVLIGNPFSIHDASNEYQYDGGHWMTITGVEDGRFVVSSWGETFYLDPNDAYGFRYFQVVNIK